SDPIVAALALAVGAKAVMAASEPDDFLRRINEASVGSAARMDTLVGIPLRGAPKFGELAAQLEKTKGEILAERVQRSVSPPAAAYFYPMMGFHSGFMLALAKDVPAGGAAAALRGDERPSAVIDRDAALSPEEREVFKKDPRLYFLLRAG